MGAGTRGKGDPRGLARRGKRESLA
eukprot:COSAG06_NODE_16499_length_997_cov_2.819599_1_plen_24_part_10